MHAYAACLLEPKKPDSLLSLYATCKADCRILHIRFTFFIVVSSTDMVYQGGDAGGKAAIAELIKEATLLSSMRHPNVVWVYGIVLKPMNKDDEDDDDDELSTVDRGDASTVIMAHAANSMQLLRP